LTTFVHHFFFSLFNSCFSFSFFFFFTFQLLFLFFFFSFFHNQFFVVFPNFFIFLLVNYKSDEIDANIMLTSVGRWPLFMVIRKKFWFFIGSTWVTKEDNFFLDKETWPHIISTDDCFNFKSFNPKGKKINHIRGCPLFALTFFCIIFFFLS